LTCEALAKRVGEGWFQTLELMMPTALPARPDFNQFFQALEEIRSGFPNIGKFFGFVSKHWKIFASRPPEC